MLKDTENLGCCSTHKVDSELNNWTKLIQTQSILGLFDLFDTLCVWACFGRGGFRTNPLGYSENFDQKVNVDVKLYLTQVGNDS